MRIYFGTNRNPDNSEDPSDFGKGFSQNGLTDLRFGWADVNDDDYGDFKLSVAPEKIDVGEEKAKRNDFSEQKLGSKAVYDEIRRVMKEDAKDCIIFIHGYNVDFKDAIKATAKLKRFYKSVPAVFFCFTWPSDGSMTPYKAYASDRKDASMSGEALGRGIMKLVDFLRDTKAEDYCQKKMHLFAHSMGNYALRCAVQSIKNKSPNGLIRLFDQICLFAADEDSDSFEYEYKLKNLPDMAKRVNVYHNDGDKALVVSDFTKGNPDRLGADGPRNTRLLPDKVTVINCSDIVNDLVGHSYYLEEEMVRDDVISVLQGKAPGEIEGRVYQVETRSYKLK